MSARNRKMDTQVKIGNLDTYSRKFPSPRIGVSNDFLTNIGNKRHLLDFDPLKCAKSL